MNKVIWQNNDDENTLNSKMFLKPCTTFSITIITKGTMEIPHKLKMKQLRFGGRLLQRGDFSKIKIKHH